MMERLLRHPTWLKVFSVALALLLWVMVIRQYTSEDTRFMEVPLEVINHPSFELVEGPRDRERVVTVRIDGKNLLVNRLKPEQITARVDYSKIMEPGRTQDVEIQVTGPANLKMSYSATPRTVAVQLVKIEEKLVSVMVVPDSSVKVQDDREWLWTAKPAVPQVSLTGSSVLLAAVRGARVIMEPADLVPGTEKVSKKVVPTDADGKAIDLKAPTVDVLLTWTEQPPGKTFTVKPVTAGTLPAGLTVGSITVEPEALQVRAAVLGGKLPEQPIIETEPIDLAGKTKSFTVTAKLIPPQGTTITTNTVTVTVNLREVVEDRLIKGLPLTVRGKAGTTTVTAAVTDVQVRVRGLYSLVNPLDAGKVAAYVDVEGLERGKHILPVKVEVPTDVTVLDSDPATVEVTVTAP
ncbi:MAG TPA: CdaR family protein [Symbiobacteriaceae bacterium]|nr:CdaR family protein [Symbiobacteriaceae bacterium]